MTAWSELTAPPEFLAEGRKAPLALPRETAASYRRAIVALLEGSGVPINAVEAGLSTASALLEGAQEALALANQLVRLDATPKTMMESARQLLLEVGALLRQRNGAYAIHQMAGLMAARRDPGSEAPAFPRIPRLKDFLTPLEASLERVGVSRVLEPERLGPLLVHLDEFYDDAALELQRLFYIADKDLAEARHLAPDFLRRLYTDFAHASFADHLLAEDEEEKEQEKKQEKTQEPRKGTGLLHLLPELVETLDSVQLHPCDSPQNRQR